MYLKPIQIIHNIFFCVSCWREICPAEPNNPFHLFHLFDRSERLCSAGLLPRVSSAASIDLPSDESAESVGRLQMRNIPPSDMHHQFQAQLPPPPPMLSHDQLHHPHQPQHLHQPHLHYLPQHQHQHQHQQHHHHHNNHNHSPAQHHQQSPLVQAANNSHNNSSRRLSIRHDQMSIDSMC